MTLIGNYSRYDRTRIVNKKHFLYIEDLQPNTKFSVECIWSLNLYTYVKTTVFNSSKYEFEKKNSYLERDSLGFIVSIH